MIKKIADIQYITRDSDTYSHAEQAKRMFENGIQWVQIRMKNSTSSEIKQQAQEALIYAKKYDGVLIINDSIELTKEIGAHGVHVGLLDVSVENARAYLGDSYIIGGTANTIEDIQKHVLQGADYVGLGPFRFTHTKKNLSPIIGLQKYHEIIQTLQTLEITVPIVAVGGITLNDITVIREVGIHHFAISKALFQSIIQHENIQN